MTAHEYEINFVVDPIDDPFDDAIDNAMERLPGAVFASQGAGLMIVTTLVRGDDALRAALHAVKELENSGVRVRRSYPDLVSRQDIADRAKVTRQAVGNWVRGERLGQSPFPTPVTLVSGGAWLWHDVVVWLGPSDIELPEICYPTLEEHARLDALLASRAFPSKSELVKQWSDLPFAPRHAGPVARWDAADSNQRDYSLAS
ncbi:MAG: hypothetical protein U5N21_02785 [Rhodococcus sp. (in: high G+C Gram-positive bacteria)]|nr:hypothetical protein [Rhodococcus sp. (in: high G+C Gram-positive bacteria)]